MDKKLVAKELLKIARLLVATPLHIEGELELKGKVTGKIRYAITNGEHAHLDGRGITVRDRTFGASVHVYLRGGKWVTDETYKPYISEEGKYSLKDVPPTFRKIIVEEMVKEWSEFIEKHPEKLPEAQDNHNSYELEKAEEKVAEAKKAFEDAQKELDELKKKVGKTTASVKTAANKEYALWGIPPGKSEEVLLLARPHGKFITEKAQADKLKKILEEKHGATKVRIQELDMDGDLDWEKEIGAK